jgi:hypothetical protein
METFHSARRDFLLQLGGAAGAAWISVQWPGILAAAQHAHAAAKANPARQTASWRLRSAAI